MNLPIKIHHRGIVILMLTLMATMGVIANDLYVSSLSSVPGALGVSQHLAKLTVTIYMLFFSVMQLVYGPLSDRFGRRPIVLWGVVMAAFGSLLCYLADQYWMLLLGRGLQGFALSACVLMYRAVLRDLYQEGHALSRAASYIMMAAAMVMVLSLIAGGYIRASGSWHTIFAYVTVYSFVVALLLWLLLPETHNGQCIQQLWQQSWHAYREVFASSRFMYSALIAGLAFGSYAVYFTATPFVLRHYYGLSAIAFAWCSAIAAVGLALGSYLNSLIVARVGVQKMLLIGVIVTVVSSLVLLLLIVNHHVSAYLLVALGCCLMFGEGMAFENATATALQPFGHCAGTATACYGFMQLLGASIMTLLLSIVAGHSYLLMAVLLAAAALIALKCVLKLVRAAPKHQ